MTVTAVQTDRPLRSAVLCLHFQCSGPAGRKPSRKMHSDKLVTRPVTVVMAWCGKPNVRKTPSVFELLLGIDLWSSSPTPTLPFPFPHLLPYQDNPVFTSTSLPPFHPPSPPTTQSPHPSPPDHTHTSNTAHQVQHHYTLRRAWPCIPCGRRSTCTGRRRPRSDAAPSCRRSPSTGWICRRRRRRGLFSWSLGGQRRGEGRGGWW